MARKKKGIKLEFIDERTHINDLVYVRDLLKVDLHEWVEDKKNGKLKNTDKAMDIITNISIINDAAGSLNSQLKMAEDGTKVVVRTDLRRLANEAW